MLYNIKHTHYESIDSTQKEAWRLYEDNKDEAIISASIQTDGIGTHGRRWYTDCSNNIAFSILLKPNCSIDKLDGLTVEVGRIIQKIFKDKYYCSLDIKLPNDLMFNGKKIGGILLQTKLEKDIVKGMVIGIGINTSQEKFNEDIKDIASSIKLEFNKNIDTEEFINTFYLEFVNELVERNVL